MQPAVGGSQEPGQWTEWRKQSCQSGCTEGSLGYQEKTRECQQSRLVHTLRSGLPSGLEGICNLCSGCRGPATGMDFCDDSSICLGSRKDTTKYATEYCNIFSNYVASIAKNGQGVQVE